ncbi:hypothetical protein PV327_000227 [Microctonus hyperodae]|uniref:Amidase domain-containing protein n=1 Tax=Microctonus hyperodae TaxID=165561 RepID=A0AA39G6S3_MICHY|nr:hypothetical protein PV327_000227 [Microctonus hyperodae]
MEWTLRFFACLANIFLVILKPYFWIRDCKRPPKLPPANNDLLNISAVKLAKKIRHGEVSSEQVIKTYIERIKKVNPLLNSVVENRFEAALIDARQCDKMLALHEVTIQQLEEQMPFFGVPFTVKESCGLKGLSYTGCTTVREGIKANEDSLIVQSMKAAGAIPLCVTNTPELCSGFETANLLYGVTCNPYDGRHSAGGSSDLSGSIRIPALFNGIFGHKPTPVLGPMARYAEDLHAAVKVMSSGCKVNLRLDEPVNLAKLKVFYLENVEKNCGVKSVDGEIRNAIRRAVTHFEKLGAKVDKAIIPELLESSEIGILKLLTIPDVPNILIHPKDPKQMLGDDSVFIYPTFPTPAPRFGQIVLQTAAGMYSLLCNILGLPATEVPMGLNHQGLPIGFQVIILLFPKIITSIYKYLLLIRLSLHQIMTDFVWLWRWN